MRHAALVAAIAALPPLPLLAQQLTKEQRLAVADEGRWTSQEVGVGVWLRQRRFDELFGGPQCVTALRVRPAAPRLRFDVEAPGKLTRTSRMAADKGALCAINGGFFAPDASPVGLLRLDDQLVSPATEGQGCIGVDDGKSLRLELRAAGDWPQMREALGVGVFVLDHGRIVDHGKRQRSIRHPRTAIGRDQDGGLLLVTVDGRTKEARGMSYEELGELFLALGCRDAVNLDGGGSSTLWVASQGVCNHPCDNKKFDHDGERAVANALLLFAPAVVVVDDDAADLIGEGIEQIATGRGIHGQDCAWFPGGSRGSATFAADLPLPGKWRAFVWSPSVADASPLVRVGVGVLGAAPQLKPANLGPERWTLVGEFITKEPGAGFVTITGRSDKPFVADAVKFVQVD